MDSKRISLSTYVTDYIVYLSINDTTFLKSIRQSLHYDHFTNSSVQWCMRIAFEFFDTYQKAPVDVFPDLLVDYKSKMEPAEFRLLGLYLGQLGKKNMDERNYEYVLDSLNKELVDLNFCRSIDNVRDLVSEGKVDEAKSLALLSFRSVLPSKTGAVDYFEDHSMVYERDYTTDFMMPSGIQALDEQIGGFRKQNFITWMAGYKGGKTWCLQHMAKTALSYGLNVYHASFEVPQAEMQMRYDQLFGRLSSAPERKELPLVYQDDNGRPIIAPTLVESVYDRQRVIDVRNKLKEGGGKLLIEKFEPYTGASIMDIEDRITFYEQSEGIKFNLILTDYADLMKPINGNKDARDQLNVTYMLHKMLADKYNCLVMTVSQVQRSAIEAPVIRMSNLAEDIRKAANSDACIAICRTPEEKERHFKKIFVAGGRSMQDGIGCGVYDNLAIGQFSEWSVPLSFNGEDA